MPTANTKVLTARIDKSKYYMLLERASARKMALSAYINVVFDELLKKEVVQKAENGAILKTGEAKPTECIAFKDYPNIIIRVRYGNWTMHHIDGRRVSIGTSPRQLANGCLVFDGYPITYDSDSKFRANKKVLDFYTEHLEIKWDD